MSEIFSEGNLSPRITLLQYFLHLISLYYPSIPRTDVTGIYDAQTQQSVIEYQKTMRLEPTGIVDSQTWESIYSNAIGILRTIPPQSVYLPYLQYSIDYSLGDQGPGVFFIQEMLQYISLVIPEIPYVEVTEVFDEATRDAIIAFQTYINLEPTGIANQETWDALNEVYRIQRYGSGMPRMTPIFQP